MIAREHLAHLFRALGQFEETISQYQILIKLAPIKAEYDFGLGLAFYHLKNHQAAMISFRNSLAKDVGFASSWVGIGLCQSDLGEIEESCQSYGKALAIDPNHIDALNNYASLLLEKGEPRLSRQYLERLISIHPKHAAAYNNLGNIYTHEGDYHKACECFKAAIAIDPDFITANFNLASRYVDLKQYQEAKKVYQEIIHKPASIDLKILNSHHLSREKALAGFLLNALSLCEWEEMNSYGLEFKQILSHSFNNPAKTFISPYDGLALNLSLDLQKSLTEHSGQFYKQLSTHLTINQPLITDKKDRLRVAYLSPDFGDHPVGLLISGLFSKHDKSHYETYGLALKSHHSEMGRKLVKDFDHFIDVSRYSDTELIDYIRELGIHILIDLAGFTCYCRPAVLAARVAPIQAHWLGYPGTLGLKTMDYYLTTTVQVPDFLESHFTEKMAYLPDTLIANDQFTPHAMMPHIDRKTYGLSPHDFIFCCFHHHYRWDSELFYAWLEILKRSPNSRLWLLTGGQSIDSQLKARAVAYGIAAHRLIFSEKELMSVTWRHRLADLWLDTRHLSGGTAVNLSAWAGLPVLTIAGDKPQSRTGAALNSAVGMQTMNVPSLEAYIQQACQIAASAELQQSIKASLLENRTHAPLFKADNFIKELEMIYQNMWQHFQAGYAPQRLATQGLKA